MVVGTSNTGDATSRFAVARLKTGGGIDSAFSGDGKVRTVFPGYVSAGAFDVAVQDDGKIVVVGEASAASGGRGDPGIVDIAIARYKAGGALDDALEETAA